MSRATIPVVLIVGLLSRPLRAADLSLADVDRLVKVGAYGEAERILRGLDSPLAKARRALFIFKDTVEGRERGITSFDPALAERLAQEALPALQQAAPADPVAARVIGRLYECGIGVKQDDALAFRWDLYAARKGDTVAIGNVGICYRDGLGIEKDSKQAFAWIKRAAEAGNLHHMVSLGDLYRMGDGVPVDTARAASWYEKAAKGGSIDGMLKCAIIALKRSDKSINDGDASSALKYHKIFEKLMEEAAIAGDAIAMRIIGACEHTKGLQGDPSRGFSWFNQSAESGLCLSLFYLAGCYLDGWGCTPDPEKVAKLLDEALAAAKREGDEKLAGRIEEVISAKTLQARRRVIAEALGWQRQSFATEPESDDAQPSTGPLSGYPPLDLNPHLNPGRPKKRRYASQATNRAAVDAALGQMVNDVITSENIRQMTHQCGAPTLNGTPCRRLVVGPGYCWQHR